ncbi:hypothetical protein ACHAXT_012912 [Thalassiosira profunda]
MNETTILLSSDPKAKPDFLATVEPLVPKQPPFNLPFELVLDRYTREPWSRGTIGQDDEWQSCYLVSTDGRNRLPGFLKYLQERKKAAFAKFEATDGPKALLVVPHDHPPIAIEEIPEGVDESQVVFVKYLRDESILRRGDTAKKQQQLLQQQEQMQQQKMAQQREQQQKNVEQKKQLSSNRMPPPPVASGGKSGGFLGNLLGAQLRTENHLGMVRGSKKANEVAFDPNTGAAGCINAFRKKISADLERFKSDQTIFVTKISISHASLIKSVPTEEQDKVTMDVFKFAVYEQVEEIGADRWIAAKEPTEFMDECTISVYKEGHCPADVLEDLNKGELPDEIRGQAKYIVEAQSKMVQRKGKVADAQMVKNNIVGEANVTVLNTAKRDRRTMEQIQKDLQEESEDVKRGRFE